MSAEIQMSMVQGEPYHAVVELLDGAAVAQDLPAGDPKMYFRKYAEADAILLDATAYLVKAAKSVTIDIPGAATAALPESVTTDLWVGDTRLFKAVATVDRSATR
jgi:hypothetical protein